MLKDFTEGIGTVIVRTWGNAGLIGLLLILLFGFYLAGSGAGWWDGKEQGRVTMLKTLHELSAAGIEKDPHLAPIYRDIIANLTDTRQEGEKVATPIGYIPQAAIYKFIAGATVWLLALLVVFVSPEYKRRRKRIQAVAAIVFLMILSGAISAVIPTLGNVWVNYLLLPIIGISILIYAGIKQNQKKSTRPPKEKEPEE